MKSIACVHCGYLLAGLTANRCVDCGHVYLRCPECGKTQEANEAQGALVQGARSAAAWLPTAVQIFDLGALSLLGTIWVVLGFGHDSASLDRYNASRVSALAIFAIFCAAVIRVVILRLRSDVRAVLVTTGLITGTWLVGLFFTSLLHVGGHRYGSVMAQTLPYTLTVLACLVVGSGLGRLLAGALLLLLLGRDNRRWIIARYKEARRDRLLDKVNARPPSQPLLFCTHCCHPLPELEPETCPTCSRQRITCPDCGAHCAVSATLPAVLATQDLVRWAFLIGVIAIRSVVLFVVSMMVYVMLTEAGFWRGIGRVASPVTLFAVSSIELAGLVGLAFLARWVVFTRRGYMASAAGLAVVVVITAAVWHLQSSPGNLVWSLVGYILAVMMAATAVVSVLGAVFLAALPKRRMFALNELEAPAQGSPQRIA